MHCLSCPLTFHICIISFLLINQHPVTATTNGIIIIVIGVSGSCRDLMYSTDYFRMSSVGRCTIFDSAVTNLYS